MVSESEFKSEDRGFDSPAGLGEEQFSQCPSESTFVQTCVSDAPFVCTTLTHICAHVKEPISICRKREYARQPVVGSYKNTAS